MARKKKTPPTPKPVAGGKPTKAEAISGIVQESDFDALDDAMVDTKVEGVVLDVADDIVEEVETEADGGVDTEVDIASDSGAEADIDEADIDVAAAPAPVTPVAQRNGFLGPLFGGALAALIGFGGALYFKAAEWPVFGGSNDVADTLTVQSTKIEDLALALKNTQAQGAEGIAALSARIDALPKIDGTELLPAELQAKLVAQKAEMDALQENLDKISALTLDQISAAQAQQETAVQAEARAKARGALNALRVAMNTGVGYAEALPDIAAATDIPDVLTDNASTGIPSAATLEAQFSAGARRALSASLKASAGDAPTDRLKLFLQDQLGARSLTPRDGDDADAVLSRAEAAVKSGDLGGALATVEMLPDAGKSELQDWATATATRRDALAALDSLSDALNAN